MGRIASLNRVLGRFNGLVVGILRSPFHLLLSWGLTAITVTGRRTGKRYTIPVGYQRDGETVDILVSEAPTKQWWRNYEEPRPMELRLRGRSHRGTARALAPDDPAFLGRCEETFRRVPGLARSAFGIAYDRSRGLTEDQARHLVATARMVRVDLER